MICISSSVHSLSSDVGIGSFLQVAVDNLPISFLISTYVVGVKSERESLTIPGNNSSFVATRVEAFGFDPICQYRF